MCWCLLLSHYKRSADDGSAPWSISQISILTRGALKKMTALFFYMQWHDIWKQRYLNIIVFSPTNSQKLTVIPISMCVFRMIMCTLKHKKPSRNSKTPVLLLYIFSSDITIEWFMLFCCLSFQICSVQLSTVFAWVHWASFFSLTSMHCLTLLPCPVVERQHVSCLPLWLSERGCLWEHTHLPVWKMCVCASVCLRSILVCVSERLLFFESKGGLLFWKSPSQFLAPLRAAAVVAAEVVAAATAVAAAATAGWLPWEKSISWVNGRDSPLRGQMVVNNQGRIGKALIPCFVLFHLLEARMGWGWRGWVREKGTLGSW